VENVAIQSLYNIPVHPQELYPRLEWDRDVIVLGIESTAHTFGVGIASTKPPFILADARSVYRPEKGGIHPREAASHHTRKAPEVLREALEYSGLGVRDVDAIAVALGPGLGPALRVGATIARGLSVYFGKKLVPVNHAVAHLEIGKLVTGMKDPLILYVSGGNTTVTALAQGKYRVFGETLDIALGNLLDTFARDVGLAPPYIVEGMHVVDRCAEDADEPVLLPYVVKGMDVSFSGLLTAAERMWEKASSREKPRICLGLREAAYGATIEVAERGVAHTKKKEVLLTGGVAASPILRDKFRVMASYQRVRPGYPPARLSGDNGAMIAWTGLLYYLLGVAIRVEESSVKQRWRIDAVDTPWL